MKANLLGLIVLASCTASFAVESKRVMLDSVKVTEIGHEPGEDASECRGFTLSADEVKAFFRTAEIPAFLSVEQVMGVPCYVRGEAKQQGRRVAWEIRADGVARISTGDTTETYVGTLPGK